LPTARSPAKSLPSAQAAWIFPAVVNLALVVYYLWSLAWTPLELVRFLGGLFVLWAPCAFLLFLEFRNAIGITLIRGCLSALASYALTTLLYFGFASLRVQALFYVALMAMAARVTYLVVTRPELRPNLRQLRVDWVLTTIVTASLVVMIPFSWSMKIDSDGVRRDHAYADQYYHTGLASELLRHVPPSQATIRAGTPERAYHMFPHLTTMLIARFTGQEHVLRAHIVYHYAVDTVLICLALYAIGVLITGDRVGGYAAASSGYLLAFLYAPFISSSYFSFYFTLFPQFLRTLFPTALTSPQMYSGIAVMYGAMLAVACLCYPSRIKNQIPSARVAFIAALLVASTLRFRIHVFLVLCPAFCVVAIVLWWRDRKPVWPLCVVILAAVSALLLVEMRSPVYLADTAKVKFGWNHLNVSWLSIWPLSDQIHRVIARMPNGLSEPVWQVLRACAFAALNLIGIPLCIAIAYSAIGKRSTVRASRVFLVFTGALIAMSIALSVSITMDYDAYSVPGQLLLHVGWYVLPFTALPFAAAVHWARGHIPIPRFVWVMLAAGAVMLSVTAQRSLLDGWRHTYFGGPGFAVPDGVWDAFQFLRTHTPGDAVVLNARSYDQRHYLTSGLAQRAAFLEDPDNRIDLQALRLLPEDNRTEFIHRLWSEKDSARFCAALVRTPVTHIIEYRDQLLVVQDPPCLKTVWSSSDRTARIRQKVH
jgi:hypothetical protein